MSTFRSTGRSGLDSGSIKAHNTSWRGTSTTPDRLCYSPRGHATAKLEGVTGKLNGLYTDLESEKQQRQLSEREKYGVLKDRVTTLEREVRQDLARRNESERQLQLHIETELQGLSDRLTGQMSELQIMVKNGMEALNRTVDDLGNALTAEQEQRKLDVDHVGSSLCARLDEVVQTVDDERFARLEQERQSLRRIGEDLYKLNERVECERKCREHAVGELAGELQDFATTRSAQEEQKTMRLTEELACLRSKLSAETADRMQEDEAIVHAINEYTKALQAGLRIVGST